MPARTSPEEIFMIQIGQRLTPQTLKAVRGDETWDLSVDAFFPGRRVVLFGLPGAFTPVCSSTHVPGFLAHSDSFVTKGIDTILCVSTNDAYVLKSWGQALNVGEKISFLSDGNNTWLASMGLTVDLSEFGMGERSLRFAMVLKYGVVQILQMEKPAECAVSSALSVLKALEDF